MIEIRRYPFFHHLRSDASSHVMKFAGGNRQLAGRGLSFWFRPELVSIMELPLDDRELPYVVNARSSDFQDIMAQGSVMWRISDVDTLANRVDFSIDLARGHHIGTPLDHIGSLLASQIQQAATDYLGALDVRIALDKGVRALQRALTEHVRQAPELDSLGIEIIAVHVANLAPTPDLARALQTPTFERIQQEADEATFARRAQAVEKEQAIAENELNTRIELARRERELIDHEAENARQRAEGDAVASEIETESEAQGIRVLEGARTAAERERLAAYRGVELQVMFGLAAQEFASKLQSIDHLSITPELVGSLANELAKLTPKRD